MAATPTDVKLDQLVINSVESQEVYKKMEEQGLINENEIYLVDGGDAQEVITANGILKGDGQGNITAAETQEATLVDVPNGLLKGDGSSISAAVAGTDYAAASHKHTKSQISDFPTSMPASDVSAWAKAKIKPTYTASEVGAAPTNHNHNSLYLSLSGGTLTGDLTGKYIIGTWLQTTAASDLNKTPLKIAVLDNSGWVYYRTPAEILGDIGAAASGHTHAGHSIHPTSIELNPGTSADYGGYIDFHYKGSTEDYTVRLIESAEKVLFIQAPEGTIVSDSHTSVPRVRNEYFAFSDTTPSANGQICWTYS